jgi:hypothetical protein
MRCAFDTVICASVAAFVLAGCGLNVTSPDLFVLTRTGQGKTLSLLVNDGGTIRCNGGPSKQLPDPLLLQARDIASALDSDAKANLRLPLRPGTVFTFTIKLANGTISFPDAAASARHELSRAELFAVQASQGPCGLA